MNAKIVGRIVETHPFPPTETPTSLKLIAEAADGSHWEISRLDLDQFPFQQGDAVEVTIAASREKPLIIEGPGGLLKRVIRPGGKT